MFARGSYLVRLWSFTWEPGNYTKSAHLNGCGGAETESMHTKDRAVPGTSCHLDKVLRFIDHLYRAEVGGGRVEDKAATGQELALGKLTVLLGRQAQTRKGTIDTAGSPHGRAEHKPWRWLSLYM